MTKSAQSGSLGKDANIVAASRLRDWKLLGFAQKLLIEAGVQNTKDGVHRTRLCHAARAYNAESISINLTTDPDYSHASLAGLQTCGCVWGCPVCARRIAVQRGHEIGKLLAWAKENKFTPIMITLTASHTRGMDLADWKGKFKLAWRYFAQSRRWRNLKADLSIEHSVKAIEVTWGAVNWWHYHQHGLLLIPNSVLMEKGDDYVSGEWRNDVAEQWLNCLNRAGLSGVDEYACHISAHGDVGKEYLSKLGLTEETTDARHELSGGSNKGARGRSIWSILRKASEGDEQSQRLYVEYVRAMTGDNWIVWSNGLKALVGVGEIDDETASENDAPEFEAWMELTDEQYAPVRWQRAYAELLKVAAETRSKQAVRELLDSLRRAASAERLNKIADLTVKYEGSVACWRAAQKAVNRKYSEFGQERVDKHFADMKRYRRALRSFGEPV